MPQTSEPAQDLSPADFRRFFKEVHGFTPFPWQEELVTRVLDRGWPDLIDVPTGLGKTAVLDAAVFLSALRSKHARRRVFLVVDRRLIVDQAHDEARKIQRALENPPPDSVCACVRAALARPGDDAASVLDVTRMRGGVNWSWLWIERPDRHAVVTGTVDQVGSRLLFRGYGVGERVRPIDAAMVGTDSLIVIDEAHLSDPFFTTLRDALVMDGGGVGRPPIVVAMSASPESGDSETHGITAADVEHEVAGPRLRAPKSLHMVTVPATAATATPAMADALAYWAKQLGGPGKVTGVIANTVRMARLAFERLRGQVDDPSWCVLLTGRVRPIDREYLLATWYPRIKSGASRDAIAEMYVVATQTIEAGADIDFDAMVTQSASVSALVQRLGRVNRLGERDSGPVVVLHADKFTDPVYGPVADQTWTWLTSLVSPLDRKAGRSERDLGAGLGASPAVLRELVSGIPKPDHALLQGTKPYVPVISRSMLDAWTRTSPTPHPDAPVAPYLHGIATGEPTVSLAWRADVRGDDPQDWARSVELIPPTADEAIELPISAVRRWLSRPPGPATPTDSPPAHQAAEEGTSDLESQESGEIEEAAQPRRVGRRVLRYRGVGDHKAITAQELRPGDYVIVPSGWGGCDQYGWHPESDSQVTDVADFVGWRGRRAAAIRIGPVLENAVGALAPILLEQVQKFISEVTSDIAADSIENDRYRDLLQEMIKGQKPCLPHERVLSRLAQKGHLSDADSGTQDAEASEHIAGLFAAPGASWNEDESAGGTSASPNGEPMILAGHQAAVGCRAREIACNLGLPEELVRAVEYAALHHDEGKRDRRFQIMLHGGDRLRVRVAPDLLAKSGMDPANRAAFWRAARLSGYPSKMRHEALSARITATMLHQETTADLDSDLVVHLVAAHHGFARPLLPAIVDQTPEKVSVPLGDGQTVVFDTAETVDWAGPDRFDMLSERYGRWGLALLESIVRLSDIWCSVRSEGCPDRPEEHDGQG
jgi:CRISPR-associated endonuclease/helicase Cas3